MRRDIPLGIIFLLVILLSQPCVVQAQMVREVISGTNENLGPIYSNGNGHISIVTQQGMYMHSNDGGKTWDYSQTTFGTGTTGLYGWGNSTGDGTNLVAVGKNGTYWKSTDGGTTWSVNQFPTSADINAVAGVLDPTQPDDANLWAVGDGATVFHSTDGGDNWNQQSTPYKNEDLLTVDFSDQNNGVIGGTEGIIYHTTNGGADWVYQVGDHNNPSYSAAAWLNNNNGFLGGQGGVLLQTTNGGSTWSHVNSGTSNDIFGIGFTDNDHGVIIGDNGTFNISSDGGSTWQPQQDVNIAGNLYDVSTNNGYFYVSGDNGKIYTNAPQNPPVTINVTGQNDPPVIGVPQGDGVDPAPTVLNINTQNDPPVAWTATTDQPFATVVPSEGIGTDYVNVYVDHTQLSGENPTFNVNVQAVNDAPEVTVPVTVNNITEQNDAPPFGSFDTPMDGSTVSGSIPVTGWVLDDVGVDNVKIYRTEGDNQIFMGDAVFVEGARPDVATSYPAYPRNTQAGWGYMMLTNFLPDGGNGTYTIKAVATDARGHEVTLGAKTITCDNANAVKPFGAIDTPTEGGVASGTSYRNQGWVLTPQPNAMFPCGGDINVFLDGVNAGNPNYNVYRADIAALFPDYVNSQGAGAYFDFDTRAYENGVHTIQWTATDDAGNTDGIGSRYFNIRNSSYAAPRGDGNTIKGSSEQGGRYLYKWEPEKLNKRDGLTAPNPLVKSFRIVNAGVETLNWTASANVDWMTIEPTSGTGESWIFVTLDPTGLEPGIHKGEVVVREVDDLGAPYHQKVEFEILDATEPPFGEFDFPNEEGITSGSINLSGWALDDVGVQSVKIYRVKGESDVFVGDAHFVRGGRKDIETFYAHYPDADRAGWSYSFHTTSLEDGDYQFNAVITDFEGNEATLEGNTFTVNNSALTIPFGAIESPYEGEILYDETYEISGWILASQPNTIPTDGSTIQIMVDGIPAGLPTYNMQRDDIAADYAGYSNAGGAGFLFSLNTTDYSDGIHTIEVLVSDDQGNWNEHLGARQITIQNTSDITEVEGEDALPTETTLLPAFPNPFNPATNIKYTVSDLSTVSLRVYDILGKEIVTLVDNKERAAGTYSIRWNAVNNTGHKMSTGIYFVVMKSGNYINTQKLMLLK